jgi:hypothetical protein
MSQSIPPVAVLVSHRVADYDAWKKAFDSHDSARKDASCLGHHINRGADDPNMVYIYCPAADVEKLKGFVNSPDLGDVMKTAGVIGPPTVTLMTPMSADFIPNQKLPGIIVTHRVESFETWRAAYDDFDDHRKQIGIVGHAVNQELGNPNQVIVYHQANDLESLRSFVESAELKQRMQSAGVIGTPDVRFVQVADFAEY